MSNDVKQPFAHAEVDRENCQGLNHVLNTCTLTLTLAHNIYVHKANIVYNTSYSGYLFVSYMLTEWSPQAE